ncbi:flavin reductase family protein [Rhizobium lusitanum]|uniref:flavin reductase family protein n=1 Tax=Rhizobium lusitanum TaxID=293958 RepID=UPI0019582092|nr:flavin reductase family protein [Rhizobium lusitanum]MBM7046106.1 flavin reductase family protein [Rhizobium lusitanum]
MSDFDARALRDACGSFATGVTVISTTTDEGDHGMTANAFMSVSLDPPLITISLDRKSRMHTKVRKAGRYAVSILSQDMQHVAMHFAGRHNPDLSDIFVRLHDLPVMPGSTAVFLTEVVQEVDAGDHTLFIGRVTHLERNTLAYPLLFCGGKFGSLEVLA